MFFEHSVYDCDGKKFSIVFNTAAKSTWLLVTKSSSPMSVYHNFYFGKSSNKVTEYLPV